MKLTNKLQGMFIFVATATAIGFAPVAAACGRAEMTYPDLSFLSAPQKTGLPQDYVPASLIELGQSVETNGPMCLEKEAAQNLLKMFKAAKKDGVSLAVTSAYRNPERQKWVREYWSASGGSMSALEAAEPGFSEHQLGTVIDLTDTSVDYASTDPDFGAGRGGSWMRKNAYKHGFVMSYPKNKTDTAVLDYEPWHWRYVGLELANRPLSWRADLSAYGVNRGDPPRLLLSGLKPLSLSAGAFVSVYVNSDDRLVLIGKGTDKRLPIASISKLMTALVIREYYKEDAEIVIESNRLSGKGSSDRYRTGDTFRAYDLLHSVLIESDNDATTAFTTKLGEESLVEMMNSVAKRLGMENTVFYTATGLDFWNGGPAYNFSTPDDLVALASAIIREHPEIFDISKMQHFILYDSGGNQHHTVENTNRLLYDADLGPEIVGGKTGTTPVALQNLVLVTKPPQGEGSIISVVLGSSDNFGDMQSLIHWVETYYQWL
jgi:LAS superfamily LD-carboxypeptidase LdcB